MWPKFGCKIRGAKTLIPYQTEEAIPPTDRYFFQGVRVHFAVNPMFAKKSIYSTKPYI
jgi:hypothetical protein